MESAILSRRTGAWQVAASLPLGFLILLSFFLYHSEHHSVFENPMLLAFLNTCFLCIVPSIIAVQAARSHYATGSHAVRMIGCGIVFMAFSSLLAGWIMPLAGKPNPTVTVHNLGFMFGGLCHLIGARRAIDEIAGINPRRPSRLSCYAAYVVIITLMIVVAAMAANGALPVFFDQATGASPLRQGILILAFAFFAVTGYILMAISRATSYSFTFWYAHATWLIAVGLAVVYFQEKVGTPLCWAGRAAQYIGCLYLLAAFLGSKSESSTGARWNLWPFLEERIRMRTSQLTILNDSLQNEIQERAEAERLLREAEQQLSVMLRSTNDGFWSHDLATGHFTFSPRWCEMLGYEVGELVADWDSWRSLMHPEDLGRTEEYLRVLLESDDETYELESRLRHKNGSYVVVHSRGMVIRNGEGKAIQISGANTDITKRRSLEEALLQKQNELMSANELLDQRVRERTTELEAAVREQEAFSYSVSHDLRAPLRHINCYSNMLAEDYAAMLPEGAGEYLARICASSNRMGSMIDQLLEWSHTSRRGLNPSHVNLTVLARRVLDMYRDLHEGHQVEIVVQEGVLGYGDEMLLGRVLENMIGNAWKFSSTKPAPRIEFGTTLTNEETVYYIRDNGVGFDMAYYGKLFKAFERLHGTEFKGFGIGLANVQKIINRHGGRIWAEGTVDKGATFYFTLPAALAS